MSTEKVFVISGKGIRNERRSDKNNSKRDKSSVITSNIYWNGCHVLSILLICGITMSVSTLIPRHDSILEPAYWFEFNFVVGFALIIGTAEKITNLAILMEKGSLISIRLFIKIFLVSFLTWLLIYCFCYIIWTCILGYNHPIPLVGIFCGLPVGIVTTASLPLLLPGNEFTKKELKDMLKNFLLYQLAWIFVMIWQNSVLSRIFKNLENSNWQCIMALLIPASKLSTHRFLSKVLHRLVGTENEKATVLLTVSINVSYGMFVATRIVGAQIATVSCMIAVEVLMQLIMTYRIVKHDKVNSHGLGKWKMEKKMAIRKLVFSELCEGLVPLGYAICFAMAYYGPNAKLIGNVKNGNWQYKAVDDANWTFLVMLGLFALDLVSLSLNAGIIWIFCHFDVLKEFCIVLQKYWWIMALMLAHVIQQYYFGNDVNLASDMTQEFNWITNDEAIITTSNSTNT